MRDIAAPLEDLDLRVSSLAHLYALPFRRPWVSSREGNVLEVIRRGGAIAAVAGLALAVASVLGLAGAVEMDAWSGYGAIGDGLGLLGIMLVLLGLLGVYAHRAGEAAIIFGLIIFPIAFLGAVLVVGFGIGWLQSLVSQDLISPGDNQAELPRPLPPLFTLAFSLVALVWALFGAAAVKSLVSLRTASIVLIFGALPVLSPLLVPLPFTYLITGVYVLVVGLLFYLPSRESQPGGSSTQ